MSILKGLKEIGWNGNPLLAAERHSIIISLYELSKHFDFRIIGMFPIILTLEHKGEQNPPKFKNINLVIKNDMDINIVFKALQSIHYSVYFINNDEIRIDDFYTIMFSKVDSFENLYARVILRFNTTGYELLSMGGIEKAKPENINKRKRVDTDSS